MVLCRGWCGTLKMDVWCGTLKMVCGTLKRVCGTLKRVGWYFEEGGGVL